MVRQVDNVIVLLIVFVAHTAPPPASFPVSLYPRPSGGEVKAFSAKPFPASLFPRPAGGGIILRFLCLMTADLCIAVPGRCALLQTHSFQDGVFSILPFDGQHGPLLPLLPFQSGGFPGLLLILGLIVGE